MLTPQLEATYLQILAEELVLATGCTEPVAIAYAAAELTALLGEAPTRIEAHVSGNILKNVKSVVVPNTGGLRGLKAAIAAGCVAGDSSKGLEVLSACEKDPATMHAIATFAEQTPISVTCLDTPCTLDILLEGHTATHSARVRIANHHANVVLKELDGEAIMAHEVSASSEENLTSKASLNVEDILAFVNSVDLEKIAPLISQQIACNTAIAKEGLANNWGANIGSVLLAEDATSIKNVMKAWGAAGSDARMSGCELPVVILSGSGNQGITASVPVAKLAEHLGATKDQLIRAVALSDLVAIEQKRGIGRLSAYCGAVSAGVGVGAAMAYLKDGSYRAVAHAIVNAVAIISGTICDGAKPSCAAKIAESIDAGVLGCEMYLHNQQFLGGDGILCKGVEATIENIGILAHTGMRETDKTILDIMTKRC